MGFGGSELQQKTLGLPPQLRSAQFTIWETDFEGRDPR